MALTVFCARYAAGQRSAPSGSDRVQQTLLATIDLAKAIDGFPDRQMRLNRVTIAPGGDIGLHSHADDPTVVYSSRSFGFRARSAAALGTTSSTGCCRSRRPWPSSPIGLAEMAAMHPQRSSEGTGLISYNVVIAILLVTQDGPGASHR
jgi:hypothetical protein